MFSYVDPTVKRDLLREGKLIFLDEYGRECADHKHPNPLISMVGPVPLPVSLCPGEPRFHWYAWVKHSDLHRIEQVVEQVRLEGPRMLFALLSESMAVNSVLLFGDFEHARAPLVRVHSNCLTGDVFGSMRCDCGPQLQHALERIHNEGAGALVYMAGHEGRGIGLWAKAITYLLQDAGQDTYQANEKLGLPADSRDFHDAALVVRYFRGANDDIRLLGNNPMKREALEAVGLRVTQEPQVVGLTRFNIRYLTSKQQKGHIIPKDALDSIAPASAADDDVHGT
ncbi:MAG TPA: GTP cyclohydrolase II [Polyangiaceae bacterium]|jgi:GTP cyclohydrolase II|nr:MAG: Riboflavin biosynthesis protein RibBA [Deltaproteobacteria bacterium ADurb.Bin207]HNS99036.1 GTP cyclohydrolase II [Polyangiaceae bacterium]HNZ25000.1 GTP cyclohydrolase II [Polyangiaceae bacterium]HOD23501.1 GTP cyclohydrolase II [Polyangiaceae bacterium]HOE49698.1 GTP cyclohydrolase II [Polyangiaceae bacterium]